MFIKIIYPQEDIQYKITVNPDLWNIEGVTLAWLSNAGAYSIKNTFK